MFVDLLTALYVFIGKVEIEATNVKSPNFVFTVEIVEYEVWILVSFKVVSKEWVILGLELRRKDLDDLEMEVLGKFVMEIR